MTKEHAPVMLDVDVRKMPTDDEFRVLDNQLGLGYYSVVYCGRTFARLLAKKWNLVLVEPSQKSLENDNG